VNDFGKKILKYKKYKPATNEKIKNQRTENFDAKGYCKSPTENYKFGYYFPKVAPVYHPISIYIEFSFKICIIFL